MRRAILALAILMGAAGHAEAHSRTYFGFQIGITNAPPPPRVVYYEEPDVVLIPRTRVYVVEDDYGYDMFRYGRYWYVMDDGYWYRSRGYDGPYRVIDVRYVPRPVFYVPARHWHHHPRYVSAQYRYEGRRYYDGRRYVDRDRHGDGGRNKGHGHGKGRGHGHGHGDDDDD